MKHNDTTQNSESRIIALDVALTIGVFLVVFIDGKRPEETPIAKPTPTSQPESPKTEKVIGGSDGSEEFRQRHNRALSPGAREDNRRKLWEENFPYKPTYDPAVTVTADMISDDPENLTPILNHFSLNAFFESDLRFSPQFEQLYRIMDEYDRTENPIALGWRFETLREYHMVMREDSNEIIRNSDGTLYGGNTRTNITQREELDDMKSCIWSGTDDCM